MNDAPLMGVSDGTCESQHQSRRISAGKRAIVFQLLVQIHSFQVFAHDENLTIAFTELVDTDDVRMIETSQNQGFPLKTSRGSSLNQLEGDLAMEANIFGKQDPSHPPLPSMPSIL